MRDPELWERLQAFEFDTAPGSAPYSVKLARAEGWRTDYTSRVVEEYRRFLYLTQVSDRQMTPSVAVDAAWHMHLTYTRDYWEVLCPKVIGAPVHHQPCAGDEEMPRYRDQFADTKALYFREFGANPPADIWGGEKRLSSVTQFAMAEDGGGPVNPVFLAWLPFAFSLLFLLTEPGALSLGLSILTGAMFFAVLRSARKRKRRGKDTGGGGCGGVGSGASDRGDGGSTDAGDGGGGGCGGCGG